MSQKRSESVADIAGKKDGKLSVKTDGDRHVTSSVDSVPGAIGTRLPHSQALSLTSEIPHATNERA